MRCIPYHIFRIFNRFVWIVLLLTIIPVFFYDWKPISEWFWLLGGNTLLTVCNAGVGIMLDCNTWSGPTGGSGSSGGGSGTPVIFGDGGGSCDGGSC